MVIRVKTQDEFDAIRYQNGHGYFGHFLTHEQIRLGKANCAFRQLKNAVKELEASGRTVWYYCTELKHPSVGEGKWLIFAYSKRDYHLSDKLLFVLGCIAEGNYLRHAKLTDIPENDDIGCGNLSGTPASCPLFG